MAKLTLQTVVSGIRSLAAINANFAAISAAFERLLFRDGEPPNAMSAPLDMNTHKIVNLAPGTNNAEAATLGQIRQLGDSLTDAQIQSIALRVAEIIDTGTVTPTPVNPAAPATVTVSPVTFAQAVISWTASATGVVSGYRVYRNGNLIRDVSGSAVLTFTDTQVTQGAIYTYSVSAYNTVNNFESTRTLATAVTIPVDNTAQNPLAVTSFTVGTPTSTSIPLFFVQPASSNIGGWRIYKNGAFLATVAPIDFGSYTDFQVVPNTSYAYSITTVNALTGFEVQGPTVIARTAVAPAVTPNTPTITTSLSGSIVTVNWTYNTSVPIDSFEIQRNGALIGTLNGSARTFQDVLTNYAPGTYSLIYRVGAVNTAGTVYSITSTVSYTVASVLNIPSYPVSDIRRGQTATGILPNVTAAGGTAPYTFTITNNLPPGITMSTGGVFAGTVTAAASLGNYNSTVTVTDATGAQATRDVTINVQPATLVLTPPASLDTTAAISVAYDSGTFTISGGVAPYQVFTTPNVVGLAYNSLSATTFRISGTGTQPNSAVEPVLITVLDAANQEITYTYTLTYTGSVNQSPVYVNVPESIQLVQNTAYANILDVDTIVIDPESDPITHAIEEVLDKNGNTVTLSSLGLSFNAGTGVLSGTPDADAVTASPFTIRFSATDTATVPLTIAESFFTSPVIGTTPFGGEGIGAYGGVVTTGYTYSLVSGTLPPYYGTGINSTTGQFTGGSGTVNGTSYTFTLRVQDNATPTPSTVNKTYTVQGVADLSAGPNFASRAAGTRYATDFTKVYVNGAEVRTITSEGTALGVSGTLIGEGNGGTLVTDGIHIKWVNDPTGSQSKCLRINNLNTDVSNSGAWVKRIDGAISSSVGSPTPIRRVYVYVKFYAPRSLYAWRYNSSQPMGFKIFYLMRQAEAAQVVVNHTRGSGMYGVLLDTNESFIEDGGTTEGSFNGGHPFPVGQIWCEQNGVWRGKPNPPAANATRTAWWNYYGHIRRAEFNTSYNANEPWLDQRTFTVDGVNQGWPMQCVLDSGTVPIYTNAWNCVQLFVEYKNPAPSTVMMWASRLGSPPRLVWDYKDSVNLGANSRAFDTITLLNQDTQRVAEPGVRPDSYTDYGELIVSETPIIMPGGYLPPGNLG